MKKLTSTSQLKNPGIALLLPGIFLCLAGLLLYPAQAAASANQALRLCSTTIVPSLFPFMTIAGLAVSLGLGRACERLLRPVVKHLSGISGSGLSALLLGLLGGYPLGAATVCRLYTGGEISRDEASGLLLCCDNCGPAFAVSVAGTAVFGSARVGFFLFGVHCLSALILFFLCPKKSDAAFSPARAERPDPIACFTDSVRLSALGCLNVCGFVTIFAVVLGLGDACGLLPALVGKISHGAALEMHFVRSALSGLLELGTGVGSMQGLSSSSSNLALTSFILGWGGLSVQAQATSIIKRSGLPAAPHFFGKLGHGVLAALVTLASYELFF